MVEIFRILVILYMCTDEIGAASFIFNLVMRRRAIRDVFLYEVHMVIFV